MLKSIFRTVGICTMALSATSTAWSAPAWTTPGQPTLSVVYETTGERGNVAGSVTAPLTDINSQALPEDAAMDIVIYRSAYSLQQSNLTVARFDNVLPGEARDFTDNVTPAWEFNEDYTYTAIATCPGYEFYSGYAGMMPGVKLRFPQNSLTAAPAVDAKSVELSSFVPDQMADGQPLQVELLAMDFYPDVDNSSCHNK